MTIKCSKCGSEMIPGPRGGSAQNYYCTDRTGCRNGENITIWQGQMLSREPIGEVPDRNFHMYLAMHARRS